jgi:hypothetical protein
VQVYGIHADSPQNYDFSLAREEEEGEEEEECSGIDSYLKSSFSWKVTHKILAVLSPRQERFEHLPYFRYVLLVSDWIFSCVNHENKASFYDDYFKTQI